MLLSDSEWNIREESEQFLLEYPPGIYRYIKLSNKEKDGSAYLSIAYEDRLL